MELFKTFSTNVIINIDDHYKHGGVYVFLGCCCLNYDIQIGVASKAVLRAFDAETGKAAVALRVDVDNIAIYNWF